MAYIVLGIDRGASGVKAVLGRAGVKKVQVLAAREAAYRVDAQGAVPEGERERALAEVLAGLPHKPQVVAAALPGREVFHRTLRIPKGAARKLDQVARPQLEDEVPVDPADYVFDVAVAGAAADGTIECAGAAARKEAVRRAVDELAAAGIDPAVVGFGLDLYGELPELQEAQAPSPVAILDLGHRETGLAVVENGAAGFARTILWGGHDIVTRLAARFRVDYPRAQQVLEEHGRLAAGEGARPGGSEEAVAAACREAVDALVVELRRSLLACRASLGSAPARIYLCGGVARLGGIARAIAEGTGIETELAPPGDPAAAVFARARCLAAATATGGRKGLNFRQGELAFKGKEHAAKRRWTRAVALATALVVGWLFFSVMQIWALEKTVVKQKAQLAETTRAVTGEPSDDFEKAGRLLKLSAPVKSPVPAFDAFDILLWMSDAIPPEIVHDVEELDIRPDHWRIRGIVDTIGDRDKVYDAFIKNTDCIKTISKGKTSLSVKDNRQKYNFDMETKCP